MDIREINEISDAFLEAWREYFGTTMYLVPFDKAGSEAGKHAVYDETVELKYDFANKLAFYGTIKDYESLDEESSIGDDEKTALMITLVFKELSDQGIKKIDRNSIVEHTDPYGNTRYYKIVDTINRVQFSTHRVFVKLKVTELKDYKRGVV